MKTSSFPEKIDPSDLWDEVADYIKALNNPLLGRDERAREFFIEISRRYNGFAEMEARVKGLEEAAGLAVSRMVDVFHDPGLSEANKKALFHEVQSLRRALGSK